MDETWSMLTTAEVQEEFTPAETATLNGIQAATGSLAGIIVRVTDEIRDAYRSGGRALADTGIPDSLKTRAISIARWRWLTAFPQLKALQTDARKASAEDAAKYLDRIANREITGSGAAVIVSKPDRRASRDQLNGLM